MTLCMPISHCISTVYLLEKFASVNSNKNELFAFVMHAFFIFIFWPLNFCVNNLSHISISSHKSKKLKEKKMIENQNKFTRNERVRRLFWIVSLCQRQKKHNNIFADCDERVRLSCMLSIDRFLFHTVDLQKYNKFLLELHSMFSFLRIVVRRNFFILFASFNVHCCYYLIGSSITVMWNEKILFG